MSETFQTSLYQHIAKYEHRYAIIGVLILLTSVLTKQLLLFQVFAITVLISFGSFIHPMAVGISNGYFSNGFFILLRYFVMSALTTLLFVYYPLHPLAPAQCIFVIILVLWCLGYFVEFMRRKNFSLWICLLFPSLILTFSLYYSHVMTEIDISFILAISILSGSVRLATSNIFDGLSLFIAGYLIRSSFLHVIQ